jgi:hypothetical protein
MTDRIHHKASNRDNKKNDVSRPSKNKKSTKNPPKFENFNGEPIY